MTLLSNTEKQWEKCLRALRDFGTSVLHFVETHPRTCKPLLLGLKYRVVMIDGRSLTLRSCIAVDP